MSRKEAEEPDMPSPKICDFWLSLCLTHLLFTQASLWPCSASPGRRHVRAHTAQPGKACTLRNDCPASQSWHAGFEMKRWHSCGSEMGRYWACWQRSHGEVQEFKDYKGIILSMGTMENLQLQQQRCQHSVLLCSLFYKFKKKKKQFKDVWLHSRTRAFIKPLHRRPAKIRISKLTRRQTATCHRTDTVQNFHAAG